MSEPMTITDDRPDDVTGPDSRDFPPGGDPDHFVPGPDLDAGLTDETPLALVSEVADGIRALGGTLHAVVGHRDVPEHWAFTEDEIAQLAPPVTALINRNARVRALAQRSPELAASLVLFRWGVRNARVSAAIRAALAEMEAAEPDADSHGRHGRHQNDEPDTDLAE